MTHRHHSGPWAHNTNSKPRRRLHPGWKAVITAGALLLAFIALERNI